MNTELKRLELLQKTGPISRREFLKQTAVLGLATVASPALFYSKSHASTPRKGGLFRLGMSLGDTTDSLDPATYANDGQAIINWVIRNNLVEVDFQGNPIPELAESWEHSKDAAT